MDEQNKKKQSIVKNIAKKIIKKILISFLIVVLVGAMIWGVIEGILSLLSKAINNLGNVYTANTTINADLSDGINITDDKIDQLIKVIEDNGLTLEDLFLGGDTLGLDENSEEYKKEIRKYLRQFLLGQVCTQYPDFGIQEDDTHYNGIIKIRRLASTATSVDEAYDMTYVRKDKFEAMVEAINNNSIEGITIETAGNAKQVITTIQSTRGGAEIPAIIMVPETSAENMPLVLICHGYTGSKQGDANNPDDGTRHFTELGNLLAANGIAAISIDFPGCGASTDLQTNYTLTNMKADLDAATKYMEENYSIDSSKIGIVGHSMGGRLASEYLDKVQAAALWAPANGDGLSGLEFLGDYESLNARAQRGEQVDGWGFKLSKQFFNDMAASHPQQKISSFTGGLLIAYDSDDVSGTRKDGSSSVISSNTAQAVKNAMPGQGEWIEYQDEHNFVNKENSQDLIKRTANLFCNQFLGHDVGAVEESADELLDGYTLDELRDLIKSVYTIDNDGNLYFANWQRIDETTEAGTDNAATISQYTVTIQSTNYKTAVEKYSLPMQVSLALCETSQNPQYVYEFIEDFVLKGHIDITIMDNLYVDTYNSWYDWQYSQRVEVYKQEEKTRYDTWDVNEEYPITYTVWEKKSDTTNHPSFSDQHHYTKIINTVESSARVTDVDTWMAKVNFEYNNNQNITEYPLGEEIVVQDVGLPDGLPEDTSITNDAGDTRTDTTYSFDTANSDNWCRWTQTENIVHNEWEKVSTQVDEVAVEQKAKNIIAQWDKSFKLPNDNKTTKPGPMLESSALMLIELLNEEETQKQQEIFKYLLYLYTEKDYGVTSLDNSIYNYNELTTIARDPHGRPSGSSDGITGTVELDGSYNVNGILLSNPIKDPIAFVGSYANHGAVDINPVQNGGTPVYAAADGTVTKATYHSSYGNYVEINHGNGVSTLYAHAQSLVASVGQTVSKGTLIMYEGTTGNSSGPHVHFEIKVNGARSQSLAEDMFTKLGYSIRR